MIKALSLQKFWAHVNKGNFGINFLQKYFLFVINVCPLMNVWIWTTCHLVFIHLKLNFQMAVSHFQIGTVLESHYLKSGKFLYLKIIALSIAIPFSHMFDLAFASSKIFSITRAKFEDHIIKFGRSQSVERKCQPLNVNVNRWI